MSPAHVTIKAADVQRVMDKIEHSNAYAGDPSACTKKLAWQGPEGEETVWTSPYTSLRVRESSSSLSDGGFTDEAYAGIWFVVVAQPGAPGIPVFKTWDPNRAVQWASQMCTELFDTTVPVDVEVAE